MQNYLSIKELRALSITNKELFEGYESKDLANEFYFYALSKKVKMDANYRPDCTEDQLLHEVFEYNEFIKKLDYGFVICQNNAEYAKEADYIFVWPIDICSFIYEDEDPEMPFWSIRQAEAVVHKNGRVEIIRCERDPVDFSCTITNNFNRFLGLRSDYHFNFPKQSALVKMVEGDKNYRPFCGDETLLSEIQAYNQGKPMYTMVDSFLIKPFLKNMKDFSRYFETHFWAYENIGDTDTPFYCWNMNKYLAQITAHGNSYIYELLDNDERGAKIEYFRNIDCFLNKRCMADYVGIER
ncbi:MAG: hypothetical protein ACK5WS_03425 [Alphaproteobacteria bacterium]|nr:hypothetical protein [Candidatus Jidaibacter sp.]